MMLEFGGGFVILNSVVSAKKALCGGDSGFLPIHRISGLGPKMAPTTQHRNWEPEVGCAGNTPRQAPCELLS